MESKPYSDAVKELLGKEVDVFIDRPLGSAHPRYKSLIYPINYGEVQTLVAPDGDYQDAYILGVKQPLTRFRGVVIAILHRLNDNEDKLIVAPLGVAFTDNEIEAAVAFQEQYFTHILIR